MIALSPDAELERLREQNAQAQETLATLRQLLAALTTTPVGPTGPILTVDQLANAYRKYAEGYFVKNGQQTGWHVHIRMVLRMIQDEFGTQPATSFGPKAMKAIRQQLVDTGRSRKYVNKLCALMPAMFRWGVAEEMLPAELYDRLRVIPQLKKGRTAAPETAGVFPVDPAVVDATLPHLGPVVADMVRFHSLVGSRPIEVCLVRPMDVDQSGEVWTYRPHSHKTEHLSRERVIFIGPRAQVVLRPYLERPADAYCFSPRETVAMRYATQHANRTTPAAWGNGPGTNRKPDPQRQPRERYYTATYRRAVTRAIDQANETAEPADVIPRWSPGQLRHSMATLVRKRFGLEAAQVVLGHAQAAITEVYAERDASLGVKVALAIG